MQSGKIIDFFKFASVACVSIFMLSQFMTLQLLQLEQKIKLVLNSEGSELEGDPLRGRGEGRGKVRFRLLQHLSILLFIAGE